MNAADSKRRGRLNVAWVLAAVAGLAAILFLVLTDSESTPSAEIGPLDEPTIALPPSIRPPELSIATAPWGLSETAAVGSDADLGAAGVALGDLDLDGDLDLVVAHDEVEIRLWDGARFGEPSALSAPGARAISISDIDADGWPDLLVAQTGDSDKIIWGGEWVAAGIQPPDKTDLEAIGPSAALMAAELSGDEQIDVVRLSRGNANNERDTLWTANSSSSRTFTSSPLGDESRLSLAGEIADVDNDGLLDIWVTRDLGWEAGGDSVYSRQGVATGPWVDIAPELGVALEIDGMGLTLADLDGDLEIDAYVSDLGNNEVLVRDGNGFRSVDSTGAARIRPPGADSAVISSSWASGAVDLNLDGRVDLVIANGGFPEGEMLNKIPDSEVAVADPPAILIGIGDGQFVETWPMANLPWDSVSRGLTVGDIDSDGDDDIVFVDVDGALTAIENMAVTNTATSTDISSIAVTPAAGCDATGAIVTVTQDNLSYQVPMVRHTYAGAHARSVVVGRVGPSAVVEVSWPDATPYVKEISAPGPTELVVPCP